MSRPSSNPDKSVNRLLDACAPIAEFIDKRTKGKIDKIYCEENTRGLLVAVSGEASQRYLLHDLDAISVASIAEQDSKASEGGPLRAQDLESYVFDSDVEVETEEAIYQGFLCRGDLAVWLGREKHRKSNIILQFAICAALGRDFLGFKFEAEKPLRVVVIDFESRSGSLKKRYDRMAGALSLDGNHRDLLAANLKVIEVRKIRKSGRSFPKFPLPGKRDREVDFWDELVHMNPADVYIIDPLRTLHSADENDSSIEALLSEIQRVFRGAAVIVAHHMRKAAENSKTLVEDMRLWSDGARGSSAIKAHTDLIVLQERSIRANGDELVHLGAFLKDGPDIDPIALMETDHESFCWKPVVEVPERLRKSHELLLAAKRKFSDRASMAAELSKSGISRATAFRHVDTMIRANIIDERGDGFNIRRVNE